MALASTETTIRKYKSAKMIIETNSDYFRKGTPEEQKIIDIEKTLLEKKYSEFQDDKKTIEDIQKNTIKNIENWESDFVKNSGKKIIQENNMI